MFEQRECYVPFLKTLANQISLVQLSNDSLATCHSSGLNLWTVSESEIAFLFESEIRSRFVFLVPTNQWNELVWKHIYVKTIARATFFTIFK